MFITTAYADSYTNTNDTKAVQDSESLPKAPADVTSGWTSMIPMVLIFVVFYFLLIRPQEKRRKAQEELVGGVKKGEEVVTASGIFGKVMKINDSDNTVEIEIASGVQVKILKSAISDIVSRKSQDKKQGKISAKTS